MNPAQSADSWPKRIALAFILMLIPLTATLLALRFKEALGPSWYASNQDPDSVYFANGLTLAQGMAPTHNDHPGTTLQSLTAVMLRVTHAFAGQGEFQNDVILRPQFYIDWILKIPLLCFAAVAWGIGWAGYRFTKSIAGGLFAQSGVLMTYWTLLYLPRLRPECLLGFETLLIGVLVLNFFNNSASTFSKRFGLWAGLLCGLGVATKITFIPICLVPLFVLSEWRARIQYVLFAALGLFIGIIPILTRLPAAFTWWWGLTTHKGMWGTGEAGVASASDMIGNLQTLQITTKIFFFCIGLNLLLSIFFWAQRKNWERTDGPYWKVLLGILAAWMMGLAMVAKHPGQHYLIPEYGLMGLQFALLYRIWDVSDMKWVWAKHVVIVAALFYAVRLESVYMVRAIKSYEGFLDTQDAVRQALPFTPANRIILNANSSSHAGFWYFGVSYFRDRYTQALQTAFPYDYQLEIDGRVGHFNQYLTREELDQLVKKTPLLIWSHYPTKDLVFPYQLRPIFETPNESLYRVIPSAPVSPPPAAPKP